MPITQTRMLAVLNAAQSLLDTFNTLLTLLENRTGAHNPTIQGILTHAKQNGVSEKHLNALVEAHDSLIALARANQPNYVAVSILAKEIGHFNSVRKRNDRVREAQARTRLKYKTEIEIQTAEQEVDSLFGPRISKSETELTVEEFKLRILATGVPFLDTEAIQNLANCSADNFDSVMLPLLESGFLTYDRDARVFRVQSEPSPPEGR